jgi:hypothetical protein
VPAYASTVQMNRKDLLNENGFVSLTMDEGETASLNVINE